MTKWRVAFNAGSWGIYEGTRMIATGYVSKQEATDDMPRVWGIMCQA
jgi:hypothetical protein